MIVLCFTILYGRHNIIITFVSRSIRPRVIVISIFTSNQISTLMTYYVRTSYIRQWACFPRVLQVHENFYYDLIYIYYILLLLYRLSARGPARFRPCARFKIQIMTTTRAVFERLERDIVLRTKTVFSSQVHRFFFPIQNRGKIQNALVLRRHQKFRERYKKKKPRVRPKSGGITTTIVFIPCVTRTHTRARVIFTPRRV